MTYCVGPSMIVGKPCLNGSEGPHLDLDGEHEYQPAVVVPSAVLWRDCDECDGTGTYHVEVTAPPPEDSGDYPCEAKGCVNGRVRVGVCWIEPSELDGVIERCAAALYEWDQGPDPLPWDDGTRGWYRRSVQVMLGALGVDAWMEKEQP